MQAEKIDQNLQKLEDLLETLDASLGKNSKFTDLVKAVDKIEQTIDSRSEQTLIKQALDELDNQLDSIFGIDRDYIVESGDSIKFNFTETLSANFGKGLPTLQGDLFLDFSLTDDVQGAAGFKKVQLDLGSYLDDLVEPFFDPVQKILRPFEQIQRVLTTNIPGLDTFGININLLYLAETIGKAQKREYNTALFDKIGAVSKVLDAIDKAQTTVESLVGDARYIDLGEFSFSASGEITNLSLPSVSPIIQATNKLTDFFRTIGSLTDNRLQFPLLDDAKFGFELLLGKTNVPLIEYTLPGLTAGFEYKQKILIPVPLPIPVFAQFGGEANISSPGLTIGYDSFGITSGELFNGFYLDGSQALFKLDASLFAGVSAGIEKIAYAEGNVNLGGDVKFYLPDRDPQVRYNELLDLFSSAKFEAEGEVKASLTVYAEHITLNPIKGLLGLFTGDFEKLVDKYGPETLEERNIFEFGSSGSGGGATPVKPNLATYDSTTRLLRLNMGAPADRNKRNVSKDKINEEFTVNPDFSVAAFGQQEAYSNVVRVVAFADDGTDKIVISANVVAELHGGTGADTLSGGEQGDWLYGEADNDHLSGNKGDDQLYGNENSDELYGGEGIDSLWGGSDNDVLNGNAQSDVLYGEAGQDVLYGGDASDTNDGDDFLDGGAGNDLLIGEAGNDTLDGGSEIDVVAYLNSPSGVVVNLNGIAYSHLAYFSDLEPSFTIAASQAQDGYGALDTLLNLEGVLGSSFDDILIGNDQNNAIAGLAGNDFIIGNAGDDIIQGDEGIDTISYRRDPKAVNVHLATGIAQDGFGSTDKLQTIENIVGSAFQDKLTGNAADNTILGGASEDGIDGDAGNDRLFGEAANDKIFGNVGDDYLVGGAGTGWPADILDGGVGTDTASYITATAGVAASLAERTGWMGDATGDQFISIENLEGSSHSDMLTGDQFANRLKGLDGDDTLEGRNGDDTLEGDAGRDTLWGNDGHDKLQGGDEQDTLIGDLGNDTLEGEAGNDRLEGGLGDDVLIDLQGDNRLDAGEGNNTVQAGNGNDLIYTGPGNDVIDAGDGNNQVFVGEGTNQITAGSGDDLIYGGAGADRILSSAGNDVIRAAEGDNYIDAGIGNNTIYSGSGSDLFVLHQGSGITNIRQFDLGKDRLGLTNGLTFEQLSVIQGSDTQTSFTQVRVAATGDVLATLNWVSHNSLTQNSFVSV